MMSYWALVAAALLSNLSPATTSPRQAGLSGGMAPAGLPTGIGIKQGVVLRGLDRRMHPAVREARDIWRNHGQKLVITSGLDGKHAKGSRHYAGLALDFRSRDLGRMACSRAAHELRQALGPAFLVLLERDHIHVEYRPPPGSGQRKLARLTRPGPKVKVSRSASARLAKVSP